MQSVQVLTSYTDADCITYDVELCFCVFRQKCAQMKSPISASHLIYCKIKLSSIVGSLESGQWSIAVGCANAGLHYHSLLYMSCDDGLYLVPQMDFCPEETECASSSIYPPYSVLWYKTGGVTCYLDVLSTFLHKRL